MSTIKKRWSEMPDWAKYTLYTILGLGGAVLIGLLLGNVILWLWNWLMPKLFGLRTIGFWEALGLFALMRILIGFGSSSHSDDGDSRKQKKNKRKGSCSEEKETGKSWKYYDEWWEQAGKEAFRAYADRMGRNSDSESAPKPEEH
ncbi:MAG: hypothetical protein VB034_11460 [Eubacteriales bacterium]|nr:hypothetical protein [Eubacteriales bacterium]